MGKFNLNFNYYKEKKFSWLRISIVAIIAAYLSYSVGGLLSLLIPEGVFRQMFHISVYGGLFVVLVFKVIPEVLEGSKKKKDEEIEKEVDDFIMPFGI